MRIMDERPHDPFELAPREAQDDQHAAVATLPRPVATRSRMERAPEGPKLWNVILMDDDDHSYEYVVRLLQEVFGRTPETAYTMAKEVDTTGRVICTTTHLEHAELKQEQIHSFGPDKLIASCKGAMSAMLEPVCQ